MPLPRVSNLDAPWKTGVEHCWGCKVCDRGMEPSAYRSICSSCGTRYGPYTSDITAPVAVVLMLTLGWGGDPYESWEMREGGDAKCVLPDDDRDFLLQQLEAFEQLDQLFIAV